MPSVTFAERSLVPSGIDLTSSLLRGPLISSPMTASTSGLSSGAISRSSCPRYIACLSPKKRVTLIFLEARVPAAVLAVSGFGLRLSVFLTALAPHPATRAATDRGNTAARHIIKDRRNSAIKSILLFLPNRRLILKQLHKSGLSPAEVLGNTHFSSKRETDPQRVWVYNPVRIKTGRGVS